MKDKARIGVIGAGWWAVVNHIPVLQKNADCEIVAVNRLGESELAEVQNAFGIERGFEDYREMLDAVPMDGVVISSPHTLHFEHAKAAIEKGCHVLDREAADDVGGRRPRPGRACPRARPRDRRRLWLEFHALGGGGATPGAARSAGSSMSSCRWPMRSRISSPGSR